MSPDLLDPKEKSRNISEQHSDDLFDASGKGAHPDLKDIDDSVDSGFYKPGSSSESLARQEAAGGSASTAGDSKEAGLYKESSADQGGRLQQKFRGFGKSLSKGSNKKKVLVGVIGGGSIGLLVAGIIMIFLVIAGFGVGQVAEVGKIANYSRLHLASGRRTTQYVTEKALNPNPEAFRVNLQRRTLLDRFLRFDPNKVMTNLRAANDIEFVTKEGTRRRFGIIGREVPLGDLDSIRFANGDLAKLPNGAARYSAREQREFIKTIDRAINNNRSLANTSRIHRTKTANAIIEASGIKLYRWEKAGRTIKTFKDSLLSAYDRLKGNSTRTSSFPETREAAQVREQEIVDSPDNVSSAAKLGDDATAKAVSRANGFRSFVRGASVSSLTSTLYCSGYDYIKATEENSKERVKQYKQSGYLTQTAYDQIKSGDTTAQAVMMEAKSLDGFSDSRRYQEATGNPNAVTMPDDLDRTESPVADTSSGLYQFYTGLMFAVEALIPGLSNTPDPIVDRSCSLLVSVPGQLVLVVTENILSAISGVLSGGTTTAGQQTIRLALSQGFRETAEVILTREVGRQIARRAATGIGRDALTFLLVDMALKTVHNTGGNSTLDDGYKQYAKKDIGLKLEANEQFQAIGGRELTTEEVAEVDDMVKEQRFAELKKQPLLKRLANLSDPFSPASQAVATLPYSPESLQRKGVAYAQRSLNPLQTVAQNGSRLASSVAGSDKVMAAMVTGDKAKLEIPTIGYSKAEMEKMLDETFWPLANGQAVESNESAFEEYKDCFIPMTETVESACEDKDLTSDTALRARLYQMDGGNAAETETDTDFNDGVLGGLIYLQDITEKAESTPQGELPAGTVGADQTSETTGCGGITVHTSIVSNIEALCAAASGDGVSLTGGGWRDNQRQIELRKQNCGTSQYAIYEMPSSQCSPPTARPGSSMHERGLAIDFRNCSRSSACFRWLSTNAATHGMYNLPSESWHWSTNGN